MPLYQVFNSAPPSNPANPNIPFASVQRVKLADAKAAFDQKTALFVDVRDADVYNINHITGAINVPLGEFQASLRAMDQNKWIITYCT